MGKYFNDVVDQAIEDIYYCCDNERAKAAAAYAMLHQAISLGSAAGVLGALRMDC